MQISCDCGSFKARLTSFPKNTPGRLVCYCSDCQHYLKLLDRKGVLDEFGGTEIIPVYPNEVEFLSGGEQLSCYQLTGKGPYRWFASCCNAPIANTRTGFPWVGVIHSAFKKENPDALNSLGDIKSRIQGKDALAGTTFPISDKIGMSDMFVVLPFIVKGKIVSG